MTHRRSLRQWVLPLAFLTLSALPAAGQTPKGTDPDPDGLCACVTRWYETPPGGQVLETAADRDMARGGWRVRVTKPWAYDPVRKNCAGGDYEYWRPMPGQEPPLERRASAFAGEFPLEEAAARCRELASTPSTSDQTDAWRNVPTFDQIKAQIIGKDACAITGGPAWSVFDNAGRQRALPGVLADRVQRGFALLNDRAWLQTALAGVRGAPGVDEAIAQMARGGPDATKQFVWFGNTFVRHYLPNASLSTPVGRDVDLAPATATAPRRGQIQLVSSEHSSVRGTCNGGGDFIRFDPNSPRDPASAPQIVLAAWPRGGPASDEPDVRLELPSAVVTADGGTARVVVDLAPSGAAAVLVIAGNVQVRDATTGSMQRVRGGDAVLVWPGAGVSSPVAASGASLVRAARPRIRGSIVLQPGERWSGPVRLDGVLPIEARLLYEKPAGGAYALEIAVNGRPLADPPLNKTSPMRYADGRNYPYREPNSARWMLFYSPDYAANNSAAGGGYEVMTDRGEAYRFVWNVAQLLGGQSSAQVQFRNGSDPGGPSLELRLLPAEGADRYTAVPPPPSAVAGTTPPASSGAGSEAKKKSGWLQGLADAAKNALKQPSTTAGGTQPAYPPPATSPEQYGTSAAQGGSHLALYTVSTLLGHGDFNYPLVVQLQDGSGRPMYPAAPLTVTVTSNDPRIVTVYGTDRRPTATLTLRPAEQTGSGGMSWNDVTIIAASASVAGTATITATAPGLPAASVTVTVVPARTSDNRSTPAQTAAPGRVRLTVLPPITETDRVPLASVELLDAQGQPTGIDFGPGAWTLESSNPAVMESYAAAFRYGQMRYPRAPGQTQLTVVSKRPGVTGSTATLTAVSPRTITTTERVAPPPAVAVAPPPPMPAPAPMGTTGRVVPRSDFGEPAVTGRISNIVTARDVRNGVAVDITDTFPQDVNPIHVWFRIAGFAPGTTLMSRWTYLGGAQPLVIGTAEFTIAPTNDYGTFNYELAEGKRWPAGEYRIEILRGGAVAGSATFMVAR